VAGKLDKYDKQHLLNLEKYRKQIEKIYNEAIKKAAAMGVNLPDFDSNKPFLFSDYPQLNEPVKKLIKSIEYNLQTIIVNGVNSEWTLANNKNNVLCDWMFGAKKNNLTKAQERKYYNNNDKALGAFLNRKTNGLSLSDRVWNYTSQFKNEIEMGLSVGIASGKSAHEIALELYKSLKNPNEIIREYKNKYGQLALIEKLPKTSGQGMYRSSFKNALRLARTETNIAYRTADYERSQQLDFIVGIEINLSNNHTLNGKPFTDICDHLQGKYPKDFKFTGWHPQCRCFVTNIMQDADEFLNDLENDTHTESKNEVKDVPDNFKEWVKENESRIKDAEKRGTLPYFIKDNYNTTNKEVEQDGALTTWHPTDKEIKQFEKTSNWSLMRANRMDETAINGFNFPEFDKELNEITEKLGIKLNRKTIYSVGDGNVEMLITGNGFSLIRIFKNDGTIIHELFELDEKYQGKGTSKELFRALYKQYKNIGASNIEVHANIDIGGYTWIKYGFKANKNQYNYLKKISEEKLTNRKSKFLNWLEKYNGKDIPLYEYEDFNEEYFKDMMLGSDWYGYIDLTDTKQRTVFEKYMSKGK
jgi:GNAT superfamily N-acetyltransferase